MVWRPLHSFIAKFMPLIFGAASVCGDALRGGFVGSGAGAAVGLAGAVVGNVLFRTERRETDSQTAMSSAFLGTQLYA